MASQSKSGGAKKIGRGGRKVAARTGAMSRYVRGLIDFKQYYALSNSGGNKRKLRSFHQS